MDIIVRTRREGQGFNFPLWLSVFKGATEEYIQRYIMPQLKRQTPVQSGRLRRSIGTKQFGDTLQFGSFGVPYARDVLPFRIALRKLVRQHRTAMIAYARQQANRALGI